MIDIEAKLSSELGVEKWQVTAAVQLIDEDNTIPFIARYRKEKTGALNDEVLRKLYERLIYLRNLEDKKQQVIATIRDQGKMTDALLKQIEEAQTQVVVDDLYRPGSFRGRFGYFGREYRGYSGLSYVDPTAV